MQLRVCVSFVVGAFKCLDKLLRVGHKSERRKHVLLWDLRCLSWRLLELLSRRLDAPGQNATRCAWTQRSSMRLDKVSLDAPERRFILLHSARVIVCWVAFMCAWVLPATPDRKTIKCASAQHREPSYAWAQCALVRLSAPQCALVPLVVPYALHSATVILSAPRCSSVRHAAPQFALVHLSAPRCTTVRLSAPQCAPLHLGAPRYAWTQRTVTARCDKNV